MTELEFTTFFNFKINSMLTNGLEMLIWMMYQTVSENLSKYVIEAISVSNSFQIKIFSILSNRNPLMKL